MKIKIIRKVVFTDQSGRILIEYEVGDILDASGKVDHGGSYGYFITSMGGIYFDEAVELHINKA